MKRRDLEHVIRAAADLSEDDEIIVIGSQAILAQFPEAPAELLTSNEADVFPKNHPERSDLIDGSIGEGSPFRATYGYYAQGVDEHTAVLPEGWGRDLAPSGPRDQKCAALLAALDVEPRPLEDRQGVAVRVAAAEELLPERRQPVLTACHPRARGAHVLEEVELPGDGIEDAPRLAGRGRGVGNRAENE